MGMRVIGVRPVVVAMSVRDGIQVDAGRLDGGLRVGPLARRTLTGEVAPRLHRPVFRRARYACTHRV
jgi:hypothetical protein